MSFEGSKGKENQNKKGKTNLERLAEGVVGNTIRAGAVAAAVVGAKQVLETQNAILYPKSAIASGDAKASEKAVNKPSIHSKEDLENIHYETHYNIHEPYTRMPLYQDIEDRRGEEIKPEMKKFASAVVAQKEQRSDFVWANVLMNTWDSVRDLFKSNKKQ